MSKMANEDKTEGKPTEVISWTKRAIGAFANMVSARFMSKEEFIEKHASGTLRKNMGIGMDIRAHYLSERTAFEFGYGFECVDATRVQWGKPISEGDNHAVTETGWHIDRYMRRCLFPGDNVEAKYITVEYSKDNVKQGLGMVVRATSAPFVPKTHMVFAIIAEWDSTKNQFKPAVNPC